MMDKPRQAALVAAVLILSIIAIIAAIVAVIEVEKKIDKTKAKMTTVYGKSFINLPHGPLQSTALQHSDAGALPAEFHPTQVAGASFSQLG